MSTEAEKSRWVISRVACCNSIATNSVRMRRIESVTRCKCVAAFLFTLPSSLSLPYSLSCFLHRGCRGRRSNFHRRHTALKTETTMRRHYSFPSSVDRRARVNRYWKHGKIRAPSWLEFLNIQRCTAACREENMKRTNRAA